MERKKRKKLCTHCEGEVDLDVIVCPFCGKDVGEEKMTMNSQNTNQYKSSSMKTLSSDETLSSLYPPPYRSKSSETAMPKEETIGAIADVEEDFEKKTKYAFPVFLFSIGINLLFLGLFLVIFSSNDEVVMRWKASLWPVYLVISVPLLIFGYRKIT